MEGIQMTLLLIANLLLATPTEDEKEVYTAKTLMKIEHIHRQVDASHVSKERIEYCKEHPKACTQAREELKNEQ
jgi:hypothetical protein